MATLLTAAPSHTLKISAIVSVSFSYKTTTHLQHSSLYWTNPLDQATHAWRSSSKPSVSLLSLASKCCTCFGRGGAARDDGVGVMAAMKSESLVHIAAALAGRNQSSTDSEPTLSASAPRAGSALSVLTPWPSVSAIWQKRPNRMLFLGRLQDGWSDGRWGRVGEQCPECARKFPCFSQKTHSVFGF